jgi:hypothetical protein
VVAASPYDGFIGAAAQRYDIEPALVKAVIACESRFDPQAVSPRGAQGLMQLMPATQATLGVADAFNPQHNIEAGVRYLALLRQTFGTRLDLLLAAYNAGPQAVIDMGYTVPPIAETQHYITCVKAAWQRYVRDGFNAVAVGVPMHEPDARAPVKLVVAPLRLPPSEGTMGQRLLLHVEAWNVSPDVAHGVISLTYPTALLSLLALRTMPDTTTVQLPDDRERDQTLGSGPTYQVLQGDWPSWQPGEQRQAVLALVPRQPRDVALHLSVLLYREDRVDVRERWSTVVRLLAHRGRENGSR